MYYTLISYPAGVVIEGVIVSRTRNKMRVLAPGIADALELKRSGNDWLENGKKVELEFIATDIGSGQQTVMAQAAGRGAI